MDGARDQLFTGSTLAQNQHRMRAVRRLGDDAIQLFHLRRSAHDAPETLLRFDLFAQDPVFGFQFQVTGNAIQQEPQFIQAERFGHIIVSAILHRLHRRLHSAVACHYHNHRIWPAAFDLVDRFQAAGSRQTEIEEHGIDALGLQDAIRVFSRICAEGIEPQQLSNLPARFPDGAFIVHDEQVQKIRSFNLSGDRQSGFQSGHGFSRFRFSETLLDPRSRVSRNLSSRAAPVNGFLKHTTGSPSASFSVRLGSYPDMSSDRKP